MQPRQGWRRRWLHEVSIQARWRTRESRSASLAHLPVGLAERYEACKLLTAAHGSSDAVEVTEAVCVGEDDGRHDEMRALSSTTAWARRNRFHAISQLGITKVAFARLETSV